ncbi:MAG: hypothetical protein ACYC8T_19830 [Myxococcaceae bacterium]
MNDDGSLWAFDGSHATRLNRDGAVLATGFVACRDPCTAAVPAWNPVFALPDGSALLSGWYHQATLEWGQWSTSTTPGAVWSSKFIAKAGPDGEPLWLVGGPDYDVWAARPDGSFVTIQEIYGPPWRTVARLHSSDGQGRAELLEIEPARNATPPTRWVVAPNGDVIGSFRIVWPVRIGGQTFVPNGSDLLIFRVSPPDEPH